MDTHCRSVKGRVGIVVLHAAAVMAPWEDAGTRQVREESTWSGSALSSTLQDFARHLWQKTNKIQSHCFKVSCLVCSSKQTVQVANMKGYNLQQYTGKTD